MTSTELPPVVISYAVTLTIDRQNYAALYGLDPNGPDVANHARAQFDATALEAAQVPEDQRGAVKVAVTTDSTGVNAQTRAAAWDAGFRAGHDAATDGTPAANPYRYQGF